MKKIAAMLALILAMIAVPCGFAEEEFREVACGVAAGYYVSSVDGVLLLADKRHVQGSLRRRALHHRNLARRSPLLRAPAGEGEDRDRRRILCRLQQLYRNRRPGL